MPRVDGGFPDRTPSSYVRKTMSRSSRRTDLFTMIDVLQRRLERAGLSSEVVDAAITRAVTDALRAPSPAKA
jgi:hypothetical protein